MKRYKEYKNSNIAWLGEIPRHWEISKIKRVCKIIGSGTTPDSGNNLYYGGGINWIQSGDLYHNDFINNTEKTITELAIKNCSALKIYQPPFIIVAMYGASIGNTSIVNISACVNQACCVLIPNDDINISYMHYYLKFCQENFISQSAGGTQPNINQRKIKEEPILIPPLSEQDKIARYLDYKVSRINKLISLRKKQLIDLAELKKVIINNSVTKGLNPNAELKQSGVKWLGEIPAHWEIRPLKRIFEIFSGATPSSVNPEYWDGDIKWVTPADFQTKDKYIYRGARNITESGFAACSTTLVPAGSVIFTKRAPVGKVIISKSELCTNQGCLSCVPLHDISSEFFYYVISICTKEFESISQGTTFKELSLKSFRQFIMPVPPLSEQNQIAAYLDGICGKIDRLITLYEREISLFDELKARLISDCVTGQLDLRDIII